MIGTVLGNRYRLLSELGKGGMARVYLADDLPAGCQVAVKVLHPQLVQDLSFVQRFSQEAKLAMSLSGSSSEMHIARVLDYGSDRDTHYLVMDYVEGRDLRRILAEKGPLPWQEALDVARQVAVALEHAHQRGIVHRDVKPENIMIQDGGEIRVLDFGIARARTSPTLTYSGFVGSLHYVAPEQAMGRPVDIRADLYSLGIVLYEMLCGQVPFQSDIHWVVINHHIATPPPSLTERCPSLPVTLDRLVRSAIAKRPEDRFQTPVEFIQAIEAVLSGLDLPFEATAVDAADMAPLLSGLYNQALEVARAQQWQGAVDLFSQILQFDPRYRDAADRLAEAGRQARLAALYGAARQALKAGHWAEAMAQLDEVIQIAPDYSDARELHSQVKAKYELDKLFQQGAQHLDAAQWADAIRCFKKVLDRDRDHARAAELLSIAQAEQQKVREQAALGENQEVTGRRFRVPHYGLWAVVSLLILALAVQSYFFYRAQRLAKATAAPSAAISTPHAPGTAFERDSTRTAGVSPAAGTSHLLTATFTPSSVPSATVPTSILSAVPLPLATSSFAEPTTPTLSIPSVQTPVVAGSGLLGQIAFPRFDPARGTYDVHICLVDGSRCRLAVAEASQPDFAPGGDQVVVHSWKPDEKGLVLHMLTEQRIWRITDQIEAARPSVDFAGQAYVYHARPDADRQPRLYRTYGTEIQPILRHGSGVVGLSPAWTPDGRILYGGCWGDSCGILVMRADGTDPRQVAAGSAETNPEAAPDGRQVAFMSQRDGNWEVYVVNIDGSGLRRLTHDEANDGLPSWSPDGRYLAFISDRDGEWAVWVMRADGSAQKRLFGLGGSPDGQVRNAAAHEVHGWVEERISWAPLP